MKDRIAVFLLSFLSVAMFFACSDESGKADIPAESVPTIDSFSIAGVECAIRGNEIYGETLSFVDPTALVATFAASGDVEVQGVLQESGLTRNDFSRQLKYVVYSPSREKMQEYTVTFRTYTRLPQIFINTRAEIVSKETYVTAEFAVNPNGISPEFGAESYAGQVRLRGNSSIGYNKKSYKIKFSSKVPLLGMEANDEWTLIANYADKTLIRNYLAYELAERLGMAYAPTHRFVEVFLNGKCRGNYLLSDQVEIGKTRVNIPKLKPSDISDADITGGYLFEVDYRAKEDPEAIWFESYGMPIALKSPKEPNEKQLDYIRRHLLRADSILATPRATEDWRQYFDEESTILWFLTNEFFKNCDANGYSSIFFYKNRGDDKFYMGPVWDFDIGAANAAHQPSCQNPTGWWVRNWPRLARMRNDEKFWQKVKDTWREKRSVFLEIIDLIEPLTEDYLSLSIEQNFNLWTDFEDPSGFVIPGHLTYDEQLDYMKTFLVKRYEWLDMKLGQ